MDTEAQPTNFALLIGINYFGSSCELKGCHQDIDDVHQYLKSIGFLDSNITVLKDSPTDLQFLQESCPTRDNILKAMNDSVAKAHDGVLYIHYSGHGSNLQYKSGDEKDGIDECICPVDCATKDMIFDDELRIVLVNNLRRTVKLRVVFDACHSGSALDLPIRWDGSDHFEKENNKALRRDVIFISGCKDPQFSADSSFSGHPNGALTWALLKSLTKIKKATSTKNKLWNTYTWKDLGDAVRLNLKKEGYEQIPQISMMVQEDLKKSIDIL